MVNASITLTPNTGSVGTTVTVTGTNFTDSSSISTTTFAGSGVTMTPAHQTTTGAGAITAPGFTFVVPASVKGAQAVIVTDAGAKSATANFTVTPAIIVAPTDAIVGTAGVAVTGSGFTHAGGDTILTFKISAVTPTNTIVGLAVNTDGSWSGTFTVPTMGGGAKTLTATTADDTASVNFVVDPAIGLSEISGYVGVNITATGTGFTASATITTSTFGGVPIGITPAVPSINGTGGWSCTFTVPNTGAGLYTFAAGDGTLSANVDYTVTPLMTLSSYSDYVGTNITVTGTGFTVGDGLSAFTFAGATPTNNIVGTFVGVDGSWSGYFIVPAHKRQIVPVIVTDHDDGAISAVSDFTIIPEISLNPTSGLEGVTVTVTGSGFTNPSIIHTLTIGGIVPADDTCIGQLVMVDGSWAGTFQVPPLPGGTQPVAVTSIFGAVLQDSVSANFNESTTTVGTEMVTEDVLDSNGDVMWTVTHALSGVKLATAPAFLDEKVIAYNNSDGATDTETMQVEETSDPTSPGSKTTKKIVVQHST